MTSLSNLKNYFSPFWVYWLKHTNHFNNSRLRLQPHRDAWIQKNKKALGLVKSLEILDPKSKVNTLYLTITFNSSVFCRVNSSSNESWCFPASIIRLCGKTKMKVSRSWMSGALKILMARVANTSLFKRIRVVSNFCVYSNLLKTANE